MVKILKYFILIMFWTQIVQSCKTTKVTSVKHHFVSDTLFKNEINTIQLPVNYTYLSAAACKNDSLLLATQILQIGKLKLKIHNLNGKIAININTDSIINKQVREILKHTDKQINYSESIITRYRVPKWIWYILIITAVYIVYRIARIYIPAIRFLPK